MTSADLYAIYVDAYAEASPFAGERPARPPSGLRRRLRRMLFVERTIVELGRHDATNGSPRRSRDDFERTLLEGRQALSGLHLASNGT
ncbi:MAG TPA: hypothetical protein VFM53_09750 [Anaeromyxobacteraceae bacterium]|nr:hypothetical protein [Anaeromyxobacteraceae bacterium]